jgi:hypothetical protein
MVAQCSNRRPLIHFIVEADLPVGLCRLHVFLRFPQVDGGTLSGKGTK